MTSIRELTFTSHNIVLGEGRETLPGRLPIADDPSCRALLGLSHRLLRPDGTRRLSVVDLGCLEGGYAVEFARAGYDVLGIEVRKSNFERCEAVREALALPNLRFVRDDARNLHSHGPFDLVLCLGLLYHLDEPLQFLRTLSEANRQLLLLNTHYATTESAKHYPLSEMTTHESRPGRWFQEYDDALAIDGVERHQWASYGNPRSFWLEKGSLLGALTEAGYGMVLEDYDHLGDVARNYPIAQEHQRGLFVGVKTAPGSI